MYPIRSGFKRKKKSDRTFFKVRGDFLRAAKKLLKKNLFSSLGKFSKRRGRKKKAKEYLNKDVLIKQYNNPHKKKRGTYLGRFFNNLQQYRFRIAQIMLLFFSITWFIVLFVQPTFYIDTIRIQGQEEIDPASVKKIVNDHLKKRSLLFIKRAHVFFLKEDLLAEEIRSRYGLNKLEFDWHWPSRSVTISLEEKSSVLVYSVQNKYYTIDRQGIVIRLLPKEDDLLKDKTVPVIYRYSQTGQTGQTEVGRQALTPSTIESVLILHEELGKYSDFSIHSYRLKESMQRKVVLKEKVPEKEIPDENKNTQSDQLEAALESIAQAKTLEEKVQTLRGTLNDINLEKLEEERVEELLKEEKKYSPSEDYQLEELEVYTNEGWSIKFGHEILTDSNSINKYLDIFATLNSKLNIAQEVSEYVDLRFPDRIYYR